MTRLNIAMMACLWAILLVAGCDTPTTQSSGGGVHAASAKGGSVVMKVNGDPIPAAEVLSSNYVRDGLRQFIYFHNLRKIAAEEGITADPQEIDEHIALLKQRLAERGDTWEGYLAQLMITEDEYRANLEESLLQDGIVEKRVGVTDEKMRKVWTDQEEKVVSEYMKENFLPESERDTVTYEMCHDILFLKVLRIEGVPILGDLQAELIDTATLEMTCMSDEDAQFYEFLILDSAKSSRGKPIEEYEQALDEQEQAEADTGEPADGSVGSGVDSSVAGGQ